jgi:hypothetical protein
LTSSTATERLDGFQRPLCPRHASPRTAFTPASILGFLGVDSRGTVLTHRVRTFQSIIQRVAGIRTILRLRHTRSRGVRKAFRSSQERRRRKIEGRREMRGLEIIRRSRGGRRSEWRFPDSLLILRQAMVWGGATLVGLYGERSDPKRLVGGSE